MKILFPILLAIAVLQCVTGNFIQQKASGLHQTSLALRVRGGSLNDDNVEVVDVEQLEEEVQPSADSMAKLAAETSPQKGSRAYKMAVLKTCIAVASAAVFGAGTWVVKGQKAGMEFYAGYLVEQSLSVDNLFVFLMLFDYFKVPLAYQNRCLTWGIIGAMSMRLVMILLGVAAIQKFRVVILLFAGILLASSWKLFFEEEGDEDLSDNVILKISNKMFKSVDHYDGEKFFTKVNGVRHATPLLMCLVCIELSDFVFAVDSIPAVIGVTKDPFIVYSSNMFAIMALRSLYVLVAQAVTDLPYLRPAVALVLAFVGAKMIAEFFHYELSTAISLAVVAAVLGGGIALSVVHNKAKAAAVKQMSMSSS